MCSHTQKLRYLSEPRLDSNAGNVIHVFQLMSSLTLLVVIYQYLIIQLNGPVM